MNGKQLITIEDLEKFKCDLINEIRQILRSWGGPSATKWLKTSDVKELLRVSPGKLQTMRKSGELAYTRIGGSLFYDPEDIYRMLEKNKVKDAR